MKKYVKALFCFALIITVICSFSSCFVYNITPKKPQTDDKQTVADPTPSSMPYTSGSAVNIGNRVYAITENALVSAENGEIETLYEADFKENNGMATNGKKIITVDNDGDVLSFDIITKTATVLFTVNPLYSVCGANENTIFMETKEDEDEWWGSVIMAYDYKGNTKKEYGSAKLARMYEGKLVITDFVSDVRPVSLEVVDPNDNSVLNVEYAWSYQYFNGNFYYLNADGFDSDSYTSDSISLMRFSGGEPTKIKTFYITNPNVDDVFAVAGKEIFYIYSGETYGYYLETGDPISGYFGPYPAMDVGMDYAHDKDSNAYYTVISGGDYQLYRAKGNNGFEHVLTFKEESYPHICCVIGDWVYYYTDDGFNCANAPVK